MHRPHNRPAPQLARTPRWSRRPILAVVAIISISVAACTVASARPAACDPPHSRPVATQPATAPEGVIFVPITGDFSVNLPRTVMAAIEAKADRLGPGQTIVLSIESRDLRGPFIDKWLDHMKANHHVVMWIKTPSWHACVRGMHCADLIVSDQADNTMTDHLAVYLPRRTENTDGWVGQWNRPGIHPDRSWKAIANDLLNAGHIGSFDRDPETLAPTFRDDRKGEFIFAPLPRETLDDAKNMLKGIHFATGFANNETELAACLNLPEWNEINDAGRRIMDRWNTTAAAAEKAIKDLNAKYKSTDPTHRLPAINMALQVWNDCPDIAELWFPPVHELEHNRGELEAKTKSP